LIENGVVINGVFSGWKDVLSSVPQGSVLKPLLFVIYINDIDEFIVSHILKFADDTKIYQVVNSSTAIENLRSDLHNLVAWSNERQMLFNIDKCKVMHLGYNNPKADYVMDGSVLQCVQARSQDCQNEEANRSSAPSTPLPLEVGPLKSS